MSNWIEAISMSGFFEVLSSSLVWADVAAGPDSVRWWIDLILHLDDKLKELIKDYGVWTHLILFIVIFCETGLVVTPFLPGDSLLFAAGAFAADQSLRIEWLIPLLIIAAIMGDTVNYFIGHWIGDRAMNGKIPFLKKSNLDNAHAYFEKYGGKTIIIARFVPIVRTFAPFVAGIGAMNYRQFFFYNVVGGIFWVLLLLLAGYGFGQIPIVKKNFELVVVGIIVLSVMPVVWEWWQHRTQKNNGIPEVAPVEGETSV